MIEENDIEILLKAKKDRFAVNVLMFLSSFCMLALILVEIAGLARGYAIFLASISATLIGSAAGANKWVTVSRDQLIHTLQNIVNKDPDALKILANMQGKQTNDGS